MAKYWAIPVHFDGKEAMGTHPRVEVEPGRFVAARVVTGQYQTKQTFLRYCGKDLTSGVKYQIYIRGANGEWLTKGTIDA